MIRLRGILKITLFVMCFHFSFGFPSSPIFGKYGSKLGVKACFNIGAVMQGVSGFLFAFLPMFKDVGTFIGLSYLLRFLEGVGTAMAWSSALGILMKVFPDNVRICPCPETLSFFLWETKFNIFPFRLQE